MTTTIANSNAATKQEIADVVSAHKVDHVLQMYQANNGVAFSAQSITPNSFFMPFDTVDPNIAAPSGMLTAPIVGTYTKPVGAAQLITLTVTAHGLPLVVWDGQPAISPGIYCVFSGGTLAPAWCILENVIDANHIRVHDASGGLTADSGAVTIARPAFIIPSGFNYMDLILTLATQEGTAGDDIWTNITFGINGASNQPVGCAGLGILGLGSTNVGGFNQIQSGASGLVKVTAGDSITIFGEAAVKGGGSLSLYAANATSGPSFFTMKLYK